MASDRDHLTVQVLERLEVPVAPDPGFANALLELLLAEVAEPAPRARPRIPRVAIPWPKLLPAAAALAAVVGIAVGLLLALRTAEDSALAAIRQAQQQAATVPPFRAVVSQRVAGELALGTIAQATGRDWVSVAEFSWGGEMGWRRVLVRDSLAAAGRHVVWDGRTLGIDRPEQRRFYVYSGTTARGRTAAEQLSPLATLSPRFRLFPVPPAAAPEEYFVERCRVGRDDEVAGRSARTVACGEQSFRFTLWLDRESGLLLKLETPGAVVEVRSIEFGVRFAPSDFRTKPPAGATVVRVGRSE